MPQLDITLFSEQIFWFFAIFAIFYVIVSRFITPRVSSQVNARDSYVLGNLSSARDYEERSRHVKEQIATLNAKTVSDVQKILDDANELAKARLHADISKADREIEDLIKEAKENLNQVREAAINESEIANEVAAHIIKCVIDTGETTEEIIKKIKQMTVTND